MSVILLFLIEKTWKILGKAYPQMSQTLPFYTTLGLAAGLGDQFWYNHHIRASTNNIDSYYQI